MNFSKIFFSVARLMTTALLVGAPAIIHAQQSSETMFATEVWPTLQSRCVMCHNADRAEGDLRFDAGRAAVVSGGHTGRVVLGSSAADSELIRRVTSKKAGYRMPKKGPPLTGDQIAALTRWVDAGSPWGDVPNVTPDANSRTTPQAIRERSGSNESAAPWTLADHVVWFEDQMQHQGFRGLFYLAIAFCITAIAMLFAFRRPASNSKSSRWLSRLKTVLIVVLVFLCIATYIHYDAKHEDAVQKAAAVEAKLLTYTGPPDFLHSLSPPHPMHPPRLGGVYYRGNDERDSALFNGGFYRTARLEVWLTDSSGKKLQWGDEAPGELFIEFEIKRAANTTGELFNDHIMSVIGLSDDVRTGDEAQHQITVGKVLPMKTIQADQTWRCRFSIGDLKDPAKSSGKLFVVQNTSKPKAHYAIEFELTLNESGKIAETSQLWMGSLYNLNGRVFVPYDVQKILLDRWFDWRPIPEITGPQTDDPDLLGIPEHQ